MVRDQQIRLVFLPRLLHVRRKIRPALRAAQRIGIGAGAGNR